MTSIFEKSQSYKEWIFFPLQIVIYLVDQTTVDTIFTLYKAIQLICQFSVSLL